MGSGSLDFSPSQGLPYPRRGGGRGGARQNKGRDPTQRLSGCSNGPWLNSTVSVMLLVRGSREGNSGAHFLLYLKAKKRREKNILRNFAAVLQVGTTTPTQETNPTRRQDRTPRHHAAAQHHGAQHRGAGRRGGAGHTATVHRAETTGNAQHDTPGRARQKAQRRTTPRSDTPE